MIQYLDDVCSDMHVFHGIRDVTHMRGTTFFRVAMCLPGYEGSIRAIVANEFFKQQEEVRSAVPGVRPASKSRAMTLEEIRSNPQYRPMETIGQNAPLFEVVRAV